ncbi:MAG: diguanylate cyclase [Gammaproteobacteria bacterium]|nr:diguanylate cyclase [Gammaproteobacteria bacterium]MCW8909262.1 diguanylate cyclase [Gammaproteobacteria bacterium]MCW9003754.1 diguanylate cyclase [Gammaproteobacteria bacterium]
MSNKRRVSIKHLTIVLLFVVGAMSVLVSLISSEYFINAAGNSQLISVKNIVDLTTNEVVDHAHNKALQLAHSMAQNKSINNVLKKKSKVDNYSLSALLDDPFVKGFAGSNDIELVKIRSYDLDLNFIAESNSGILTLDNKLPDVIYARAYPRTGAERVMALSDMWLSNDVPFYSVLVPIGGIKIAGYLEVVINPVANLIKLPSRIHMPVSIRSVSETGNYYYRANVPVMNILTVDHVIYNFFGDPVMRLIAYNDITGLNHEMRKTVFSSISIFTCLVVLILIVSLWLFQQFLFKPLAAIQNDINKIKQGDITHDLSIDGFSEISVLARAFNKMKLEVYQRTQDLERLTAQDPLTGIANRRYFDESLRREYHDAFRNKKPISLLLIDIDYFKCFNDSNGHLAGDACLQAVTGAISSVVSRPSDVVARYGGEEFAIILPSTPAEGMKIVADHIQGAIRKASIPHDDSPISDTLTLSIGGCSIIPTDHDRMTALIDEADKALYQAKDSGRNQSVFSKKSRLYVISGSDSA